MEYPARIIGYCLIWGEIKGELLLIIANHFDLNHHIIDRQMNLFLQNSGKYDPNVEFHLKIASGLAFVTGLATHRIYRS